MGRFPGETSGLSLVWAVLDLFFSHASNGATFTDVDRQHLYRIKYHQADPDTHDEAVTAAYTQPREPAPPAKFTAVTGRDRIRHASPAPRARRVRATQFSRSRHTRCAGRRL